MTTNEITGDSLTAGNRKGNSQKAYEEGLSKVKQVELEPRQTREEWAKQQLEALRKGVKE
jgi:hypothetical protein